MQKIIRSIYHSKQAVKIDAALLVAVYFTWLAMLNAANSHPHVFAEANLEILSTSDGEIRELRHVWRFDELFSSSVLLDFDSNNNLLLDLNELEEIGSVVRESLADFDYYTHLTVDGQDIKIAKPDVINADYQDGQLLLIFAVKPHLPVQLSGKISAGVYDPTLYSAIEFYNDSDMVITGPYKDNCQTSVVRPDADEVIAQNQGSLTDAFYEEGDANIMSKLFATRLELTCG